MKTFKKNIDKNIKKNKTKNKTKKHNKSTKTLTKTKTKTTTLTSDFYSHVNYLRSIKKYNAKDRDVTMDVIIKKRVNNQMEFDVLNSLLKEKNRNGEQVRNICKSSMHWNNDLVEERLRQYIEKLNKYLETEENKYEFIAWFIDEGINTPIGVDVEIDAKKTHEYISHITENGITFMNKAVYYNDGHEVEKKYRLIKKKYLGFLKTIFTIVFGKTHDYKVESIFEIEKKLVENILSSKEILYIKNTNNLYNQTKCIDELGLDWAKLASCLGHKIPPKNLIIENPQYIKNVMKLLKNWNDKEWKIYWIYQIIIVASKFHKKLFYAFEEFFNKINKISSGKTDDLRKIALNNVKTYMNSCISKKYIELFKNEKEIKFTRDIVDKYMKMFKKRLTDNKWLHAETKKMSLKKLENMTIVVGVKEKWEEDPYIEYSSVDSWHNYIIFSKWSSNRDVKLVGKKMAPKNIWIQMEDQNVYDVNAYYNSLENELIFPNAILQKPFVDVDKNMAYNLASIGRTIGHELIHAFDDDGYYYDENGVYVENGWWHKNDIEEYEKKQHKIVEQYENAAKLDNLKIDGRLSLTENIADIGGFLLTEAVLIEYLNNKDIYGKDADEHLKDFYMNYALNWRSNQSIKLYKKNINEDEHAYSKYRVNCVLSNSKNFQRIFDVKEGDRMYFNGEDIW